MRSQVHDIVSRLLELLALEERLEGSARSREKACDVSALIGSLRVSACAQKKRWYWKNSSSRCQPQDSYKV